MQRYIGHDLEENDNGAYYLVEEADKVIAEKDKEIEQLKEEKEHLYFIANAGTHM